MKLASLFLSLCVMLSFSESAHAAKRQKKSQPRPEEEQQIYALPVQTSEIQLVEVAPVIRKTHEFELSASTWAPKNFQLPSYLPDPSDFNRSSLPMLSVSYLTKYFDAGSNGEVWTKLGLSYLSLDRKAVASGSSDSPLIAHEVLNLFSLRLGAEYVAKDLLPFGIEPAFGLAILPTWIAASRTELDSGVSAYGFPIEASVDLMYHFSGLSSAVGSTDLILGIGVHDIYGSVGGSDMSGIGLQGLLRLRM